jgi:hypothetical protein
MTIPFTTSFRLRSLCLAFLLYPCAGVVKGQTKVRYIHLISKEKLEHVRQIPFDQVVVFDNRYDTTKFRIEETGQFPLVIDQFDQPASKAIGSYIEAELKPFPQKKQTLYISIKELHFGNVSEMAGNLFFAADAFETNDQVLRRVVSFRKVYAFRQSSAKTIERAIRNFVEQTALLYQTKHFQDTLSYSLRDINSSVLNRWAVYPIMRQAPAAQNGIYKSFSDFRNNLIDTTRFWPEVESDGTIRLRCPGSDKFLTKKYLSLRHVWALVYKDTMYVPIMGCYLLPLRKQDNSLHFSLPESIPDMYDIICSEMPYTPGNHYNQLAYSSDRYIALTSLITGATVQDNAGLQRAKMERRFQDQKNQARECYLNMDSGDIIYY